MSEWLGINPYYLVVRHKQEDGKPVGTAIDLDEGGWTEKHAAVIGLQGRWYLVNKETSGIPLAMTVEDGDKPLYRARHVAIGNLPPELPGNIQTEIICYGIGKELEDGQRRMIWHFPQGLSVMDDDANPLGMEVLNMMNGTVLMNNKDTSTLD